MEEIDINAPVPPGFSTGLIPRDYQSYPEGCMAFAPVFPDDQIIPESDWPAVWAAQQEEKSSLLHMRDRNYDVLKSLDQNGFGLCWSFSSTKAVMYVQAIMGLPLHRLSAYYVAGKIKNWRDQGGWGAASLSFIVQNGVPTEDKCPKYSSSSVTPDAAENALLHRVTEWYDGSSSPTLAQKQMVSCLLKNIPCVVDLNVMSHSMCAIAIKSLSPLIITYDNSWGTQGDRGLYYGQGAYARPDGLVIPRVVTPSVS